MSARLHMRAVSCAAAAAICLGTACSGPYSQPQVSANDDGPAVRVSVERAAVSNIPEVIVATGELFAEELAAVSAKVPGRVR